MLAPTFSENELIELELLRDEEIDALVNQGFLLKSEQWNPELRNGFVFTHPEMILEITTGERYPVEPLDYRLKNINLPRVIIDDLKVSLRHICMGRCRTNNLGNWIAREMASSTGGSLNSKWLCCTSLQRQLYILRNIGEIRLT